MQNMELVFIKDELGLQNYFFDRDFSTCAFDTEATSLEYVELELEGMSFCNGKSYCYVDLLVPDRDKMLVFLAYQFEHVFKRLIGANIQFDMSVLYKYGIKHTDRIFCTQVAAHLIDENGPKGLKDNAYRYLNIPVSEIVTYEQIKHLPRDSEQFYRYGANDAKYTWMLYEIFHDRLQTEKLTYLMFKVEMPFQYCLRDLHINGILVDVNKLDEIEQQMIPIMQQAEDKMLDMLGKKAIIQKAFWEDLDTRKVTVNFNSNSQVIPILMEKYGIELTELTDKGQQLQRDGYEVGNDYYKLDKVVLGGTKLDDGEIGGLAAEHPFCRELLVYRMALGIRNGFAKKMKECLSKDGRIRCDFNDTVAATGRLSSSNPNLQNLRKLNAVLGIECRSCFIAPEGKTFIVADYAGQELRILAFVTQDPTLLEAFEKGLDLHLVTANLLFDLGLDEEQLTEGNDRYYAAKKEHALARHKGKNSFNFPVIYGSTEHGISRSLGCSLEEAKELLEKFLDKYPGIREGIDLCKKQIQNYRYVRNSAGRKRRFPDGFSNGALRQAFNFKIQGYAADMLRLGMIKIRELIELCPEWELKFVLTVHDEVVLEVKDEYLEQAKEAVHAAMCSSVDLGIPVECEVGTGKIYSEAK